MAELQDVIIVGAGPAGSAAAYFLARRGFDVLLIDKAVFPRDKTCGDALSPRALAVLETMGLLPKVLPRGHQAYCTRVFSPDSRILEESIPTYPGLANYTFSIPRFLLDDLIRRRAVEAGAKFLSGINVQDIRRSGKWMQVRGREGWQAQARLVTLATGATVSLLQTIGVLKKKPSFSLAARAYYENVHRLDNCTDFHFDGVPLPGYGWVFPVSETCANVGAGYMPWGLRARFMPSSPKIVLERFLTLPNLCELLKSARQVGPVKGFPIRTDFATAPSFSDGILLVGEACGLVNPLTAEGIDYALESGQIAAEFIAEIFPWGDFSQRTLRAYDRRLRQKFQRLFVSAGLMREIYLQPWFLNRFFSLALRRPELKRMVVDIALGLRDATEGISPKTLFKVLCNI